LANLMGWKRENGRRRFTESLLYVARKNGKTAIVACIALWMLVFEGEKGAEVYVAAADKSQAKILFRAAAQMVRMDPELPDVVKDFPSYNTLEARPRPDDPTNVFVALSRESRTKHGLNPSCVIIDELHAQPLNADLVATLTTGMGARLEPLTIYLTTADFVRPSLCNRVASRARKVCTGEIQDRAFLPAVYEVPMAADWTDARLWHLANPNLGVSVRREWLEEQCARAKNSATEEYEFRRLHLNQTTQVSTRWLDSARWLELEGRPRLVNGATWGGLDLGLTQDLTSLVLVSAIPRTTDAEFDWHVRAWFWTHRKKLEDELHGGDVRGEAPYRQWHKDGWLSVQVGDAVDLSAVVEDLKRIFAEFGVWKFAYDPHQAAHVAQIMQMNGAYPVAFTQSMKNFTAPGRELERAMTGARIVHDGNPVLSWCVANAVAKRDGQGGVKPD
ncbi:MAG: terminase large subunit, partial [Phycisphaerales bacterium]|nr:terminase large subunit [Phycisphaerales bacterium]